MKLFNKTFSKLNAWRQRRLFLTPKECAAAVAAGRMLDAESIKQVSEAFESICWIKTSKSRITKRFFEIQVQIPYAGIEKVGLKLSSEILGEMAAQEFRRSVEAKMRWDQNTIARSVEK